MCHLCLRDIAEFSECVFEAFISCRPGQIPNEATVLISPIRHLWVGRQTHPAYEQDKNCQGMSK
jgi:hypothetical protein